MPRKHDAGRTQWTDRDDAPELTEAFFARADLFEGEKLLRRGRPPAPAPKQQETLHLDAAVLAGLPETGPGWQTRANDVLKGWLARQKRGRAG